MSSVSADPGAARLPVADRRGAAPLRRPGAARPAVCPLGTVSLSVPATSANLGPGFDSLGLALDLRDTVRVVATRPHGAGVAQTHCSVSGHGAGEVPTGPDHLVAATLRAALAELLPGVTQPDLVLECVNGIPHGRGLGSSAAAIVAGLAAAWELAGGVAAMDPTAMDPTAMDPAARSDWLVDRSSTLEGHGDNAAAAVLGGAIVAWAEAGRYRALVLPVDPSLELVVAVPDAVLPTHIARAMLSPTVLRADAVFTGARSIVLSHALAGRRDLLLSGTEDRLHQDARASAMPDTMSLIRSLRGQGIAAVVSGAGPSVLTFGATGDTVSRLAGHRWQVLPSQLGHGLEIGAVALNG